MVFIDLFEDDLTGYDQAKKILNMGYRAPLTFVNNKPVYAGDIDNIKILEAIKKRI